MSTESIRKELWSGEIPTCFILDTEDLATIVDQPDPCFLMIPRNSYFPLHQKQLKDYFIKYVKSSLKENCEIWYECDGQKLKWHLPIGVTYDLLNGLKKQGELWNVTVHFSNYPDQELLKCPSLECVKAHFMSTVKEADSLKHGSRVMNDMKQPEHAMLWNGLVTRNFDEFWTINRKLMDVKDTNSADNYKNLPVRIYRNYTTYRQPYLPAVIGEDNSSAMTITLSEVLQYLDIDITPETTILSQGIELQSDSCLYKLAKILSYPDNFLYICVHQSASGDATGDT